MEGQWILFIQKVDFLRGYFSSWQIVGILCIVLISILLVLGAYALFIYFLDLYRTQRAHAAAAKSFRARQDAMAPMVAAFTTVKYGPAKGEYLDEERCPVCRDEYEVGQELSCAPCGHAFHYQCLVDHMATPENTRQKPPTCPLCRGQLICWRHMGTMEI